MTRINVIPVRELSDQWLLAEYRELPRVVIQDVNTYDAPKRYKLGKGHVKWARKHLHYILWRYYEIIEEMKYRGFNPKYTFEELLVYANENCYRKEVFDDYFVLDDDIQLNRQRLIEKYRMKPDFYRWTNATKPEWLN